MRRQVAGSKCVEEYLVRVIKQFTHAQSLFNMIKLLSFSINLLEMNKEIYRSRKAFIIHATKKHKTPNVAQFALKENNDRTIVKRYPWAGKDCAPGD